MGEEADALNDRYDFCEDSLECKIEELELRYDVAKNAAIGKSVRCPTCRTRFVKKTKDHTFCSNQRKVKGRSSCKDKYWNTVSDRKRIYKSI